MKNYAQVSGFAKKFGERVGVTQVPGEAVGDYLDRVYAVYPKDYAAYVPLLKLLHRLGFKSTKYLAAGPRRC